MNETSRLAASKPQRLFFIDWLRIIAFALLVPFHVGMYYVTWGYHVKSSFASKALEPWMMLTAPWRMSLLFVIAGVATAMMFSNKEKPFSFRLRSRRLILPLVCGMFLVVPPQTYFEVIEKFKFQGTFMDFLALYYQRYKGFCTQDKCLVMPTWNHLWFLAYLWAYTGLLYLWLKFKPQALADGLTQAFSRLGWLQIALWPIALLFIARLALYDRFPQTHDLVYDWFNNAQYFLMFAIGAAFTTRSDIWGLISKRRLISLVIAVACWAGFILTFRITPSWAKGMLLVGEQWFAILAAIGYAHTYLNRDSALRSHFTEAVFPVYIFHQTWIIVFSQLLKPLNWTPAIEGPLLIAITFLLSYGSYQLVKKIGFLRPFFGLSRA
jgi:glucans biosynthesis protein C